MKKKVKERVIWMVILLTLFLIGVRAHFHNIPPPTEEMMRLCKEHPYVYSACDRIPLPIN